MPPKRVELICITIDGPPHQQVSIQGADIDPESGGRVRYFAGCTDTMGKLEIRLPRAKYVLQSSLGTTELDLESHPAEQVFEIKTMFVSREEALRILREYKE
jgi:hypothetical protein